MIMYFLQNSGSDVTGSCSQSESSDSDSSSSSVASSSSSQPEFSVTSSQTNGLRLTIAPVRKACNTPVDKPVKSTATNVKASDKSLPAIEKQGSCNLSSSSSRSDDTGSDDDEDSESNEKSDNNLSNKSVVKKNNDHKSVKKSVTNKVKTRQQEKKCDNNKKKENVSPKNLRNKAKQRRKKVRISEQSTRYCSNLMKNLWVDLLISLFYNEIDILMCFRSNLQCSTLFFINFAGENCNNSWTLIELPCACYFSIYACISAIVNFVI